MMRFTKFFPILVILAVFASCSSGKESVMTIKIPLVTWGGYAALFAANGGAAASEDSLFYKYGKFKVELVQEENPANQLQGFANGTYGIIWSTMDMLPLHYGSLAKDERTVPQVIGLFDWSSGGDGIVVRGGISSAAGLKGKKVIVAQYTPSHFYLLWLLESAGLTQADISPVWAADAIAAKDGFVNDASIDACVTWSPFIYDLTDTSKPSYVQGSTLLATSAPAADGNSVHGLIADVYVARADLVKKYPEKMEAFAKAMLEGYAIFEADREKVAVQIANFFGIKGGAEEVKLMFGDVIIAGPAENAAFFALSGAKAPRPDATAAGIFDVATKLYTANDTELGKSLTGTAALVVQAGPMTKALSAKE